MRQTGRFLGAVLLLLAQRSASGAAPPRYERDIFPVGKGPSRLAVDVPLLSGAAPLAPGTRDGLSDFRIFSAAGKEVPYLLIGPPRAEPQWVSARLSAILATKSASGFEADLGRPVLTDRLELIGIPPPFLKRVRLEGSGDRSRWTLLAAEGTLFDLPEEGLARIWLSFPASELRYLRVTWDDTKSGRVPLPTSVRARQPGPGAPPVPLRVPLPFERRGSEPGRSRYRVSLPGTGLPIDALEVVPMEGNVLRRVSVSEAQLAGSEVRPVPLGTGMLRRAVRDGLVADSLAVRIAVPSEAEVELLVEDGDNPPLAIHEIAALLSPLPWIYFESADGTPLVARFGVPRGSAPPMPRYDLEAERGAVERGALVPTEARWGERHDLAPSEPAPAGPAVGLGAPIDLTGFRFTRAVPDGPVGLTALLLDAHVLAYAPGLSSVRIVSGDGRQVPYLLETLDGPSKLELPALQPLKIPAARRGAPPRSSLYRLQLPYPNLPDARLTIATRARVFTRKVVLLTERDGRERRDGPALVSVAEASWSHSDPETEAPPLSLALSPLATTEAVLSVDDGDNSPLPLTHPALYLPARRLRFFREGQALTLAYGKDDLAAPRYDLALLAPSLLGASAHEVELGPEAPAPRPEGRDVPKVVFWGVLGLSVILLLGLVVRLVGKGEPPRGTGAAS